MNNMNKQYARTYILVLSSYFHCFTGIGGALKISWVLFKASITFQVDRWARPLCPLRDCPRMLTGIFFLLHCVTQAFCVCFCKGSKLHFSRTSWQTCFEHLWFLEYPIQHDQQHEATSYEAISRWIPDRRNNSRFRFYKSWGSRCKWETPFAFLRCYCLRSAGTTCFAQNFNELDLKNLL